jgi:hypothetical protein
MRVALLLVSIITGFVACAQTLTPTQQKAVEAFKDCQRAVPSATLEEVTVEGGLRFTTREASSQR